MKFAFHEVADLFPRMSPDEFVELKKDIKENGLREPICTYQGKIIDGRHRYYACQEVGIEPHFKEWNGNGSLTAFVVSLNLHRRHLDTGQRALIGARIKPMFEEEAKRRQACGQGGVLLKANLPEANQGQSRDQAAKAVNVSPRSVENASKVLKSGSPELLEAVNSGEVSVSVAAEIAGAPKDDFRDELERKVKAGEVSIEAAAKEIKRKKAAKRIEERKQKAAEQSAKNHPLDGESFQLFVGDCAEISESEIAENSVDCIITDPPYPAEYLDCFEKLSRLASRVLKPGGHCLVMSGQSHLPKVYELLCKHLDYQWTLGYLTPGQSTQVFGRKVKSNWKPIIWLTKGKNDWEHVEDWVSSDRNDKRFHHWGQSVGGMAQLINRFTVENQLILDPFCGGGSTGIAAIELNRSFVGIDIDHTHIQTTAERLIQREEAA